MSILVFCDGGSRGNPGPAGYGFVVKSGDFSLQNGILNFKQTPELLFSGNKFLGNTTNNVAEWSGLIAALKALVEQEKTQEKTCIFLDSLLVVNQINGAWKVKQPHLKPLFDEANLLKKNFNQISFNHIYREGNGESDALANLAMDRGVL